MPFSGSGTWTNVYNWVNDAAAGIKILASRQQTQWDDIASNGLSNVICKDGQSTTTALIPFAAGIKTDTLSPVTALGPVSLSAGQMLFPAVQNSSANVNTLDDYEEGTWSATDASGAGIVLTSNGRYTKIGNIVIVSISVNVPATGSAADAQFSGLPYATSNSIAANLDGLALTATDSTRNDLFQIGRGGTTVALRTTANAVVPWSSYSGKFFTVSGSYTAVS